MIQTFQIQTMSNSKLVALRKVINKSLELCNINELTIQESDDLRQIRIAIDYELVTRDMNNVYKKYDEPTITNASSPKGLYTRASTTTYYTTSNNTQ